MTMPTPNETCSLRRRRSEFTLRFGTARYVAQDQCFSLASTAVDEDVQESRDFGYEVEGQSVTWPSMNLSFVRMSIQSLSSGEQIGVVPGFAYWYLPTSYTGKFASSIINQALNKLFGDGSTSSNLTMGPLLQPYCESSILFLGEFYPQKGTTISIYSTLGAIGCDSVKLKSPF
ncbi:hypothetical protein PICST_28697 [Scheffersomyces stipitis CBS 6054]|uniref:Uncharacterized protein n=1 Tax=Scheffersomyces stipitis (strain ATCC 58785 / CBS 6054 / NBRC 10063 / NRRL Y-11545) TaxID=322104 RepID=A3GGQ7_PICST|nr:predicted protein [Scheffersomyces stipitis CBS 6054]EAZ63571.2 hypothetical protein PICST_28697 [Scheffersomyces stipitis CBS 6054]